MTVMWQTRSTPRQAQIEWGADETYAGGKAEVKEMHLTTTSSPIRWKG